MVTDPADYCWSSHRAYLQKPHADWLTVDFVAAMFGETRRKSQLAYAQFLFEEPSDTALHLLRNGVPIDDRILGDDAWTESILVDLDTQPTHKNLDELVHNLCERHAVSETALISQSRSRRNSTIRAEIALTATEQKIATVTEVATRFNRAHSGLSRAMNRLRDQQQ